MNVNWEECYKLWKEFEGLRLQAYPDPATGNEPWTIGWGHTGSLSGSKVKRGMVITKEQAEQFMKDDLLQVWRNLQPLVKRELNANQWAALISFSGNVKWTSVKSSSVIKYINAGRLAEVPGRMALYRLGDGKVMNGLVRRRAAEGALWMKAPATIANEEIKEAQGTVATPASTKAPWDWPLVGVVITAIAGLTDEVKKIVGDVTSAFGVSPLVVLGIMILGFGAWTLYNKWKGDK